MVGPLRKNNTPVQSGRGCAVCCLLLWESTLTRSDPFPTSCSGSRVFTAGIAPGGSCLQQPTQVKKVHGSPPVQLAETWKVRSRQDLPSRRPGLGRRAAGLFLPQTPLREHCSDDTPCKDQRIMNREGFFAKFSSAPGRIMNTGRCVQ